MIVIASTTSIPYAIESHTLNNLAHALPSSASLSTFRYATTVAAPIGVFLWQRKQSRLWLMIVNVSLLMVSVSLASRLSLIMAILIYAFLFVRSRGPIRIKFWVALVSAVVIFGGLTAFSYFRTANYYDARGVTNPVEMTTLQIAAYLGTPFQVSLGVADKIVAGKYTVPGGPVKSLVAVSPTFLKIAESQNKLTTQNQPRYGGDISVARNLTTNSAFADTYSRYGWWGLCYVILGLGVAAFLIGVFMRYRSVISVVAAVLLYGFADFWRIYLFNAGFMIFLVGIVVACAVAALLIPPVIGRRAARRLQGQGKSLQNAGHSAPPKVS